MIFKTENELMGTVTKEGEIVRVRTGEPEGATAVPADERSIFWCWTNSDGEIVSYDATFVPEKTRAGNFLDDEYTAHFLGIIMPCPPIPIPDIEIDY